MTQLPLEIVGSFMTSAPVDVHALAKALGLKIRNERMDDNISGKIECAKDGCVITVNSSHGSRRQRFTIAHEIAHFVLHRDQIGDGIVDDGLYRSNRSNAMEREANQYAADILMPWRLVRHAVARGELDANELAAKFQVNPAVAAIRMKELQLA